jgi:Helix-turn-helix of insertion element transposase
MSNEILQPDRREPAAVALAAGRTLTEAAAAAGVDTRTLYRWRQDPEFAARVNELRDAVLAEALGRLVTSSTAAVDKLVELLGCTNPLVSIQAARSILAHATRLRGTVDDEARIAELEALVRQRELGAQL